MNLLIVSGGKHPYEETTPVLSDFLVDSDHQISVVTDTSEILGKLPAADGIILNTLRQKETDNDLTDEVKSALKELVWNGKGLISLHISPASCPDWDEMKKITGGGWVLGESWHPPFGWFKVYISDNNHPLSKDVKDFWTYDECYCDLNIQKNINVFMHGIVDKEIKPLGWSLKYGSGKVANIALGHAGASQSHPMFQQLVLNAVDFIKN